MTSESGGFSTPERPPRVGMPGPSIMKLVFAKSNDECAFPNCDEVIVKEGADGRQFSTAELAHIHGRNPGSPRFDPALTAEEINAPAHLMVLCPNHHALVDRDEKRYPAKTLLRMKAEHEARVGPKVRDHATAELDQRVDYLRRVRFFSEFDSDAYCVRLLEQTDGEFSPARAASRARALAWCARMLSGARPREADACLDRAREQCGDSTSVPEVALAHAVILARGSDLHRPDVEAALRVLNDEDSSMARGAALSILKEFRSDEAAVAWMSKSGFSPPDLDSDGRLVLLLATMGSGNWTSVRRLRTGISEVDFANTPILYYAVGILGVMETAPADQRQVIPQGVPFNASTFPLASTPTAMAIRRTALGHFDKAVRIADDLEMSAAGQHAADYSLWLRLRDADTRESAKQSLASAVKILSENLRLVPLATQYDIPLDRDEVERVTASLLSSADTTRRTEAAVARYALASTMAPLEGAKYLEENVDFLSGPLDAAQVLVTRIELLLLGGQRQAARDLLERLPTTDGADTDRERLEALLRYSTTGNRDVLVSQPLSTGSTTDLERAVIEMQGRQDFAGASQYGQKLFAETRSVEHGERLANALISAGRDDDLEALLSENAEIVEMSAVLKRVRCWHLFNRGRVLECRQHLQALDGDEDPNIQNLRFNLSVVTGDWNAIPKLVAESYARKSEKDVRELVDLAQRSVHLDLPYTKDLVREIAQRGEGDPHALAAAYWLATSANLEDEVGVGQWLRQAIALSDEDGPLQRVPFGDVVEQTRKWNKRIREISEALRHGDMPTCVAAQALNMPLLEMTLRCAIENKKMGDRRGRGVVPAYSGVRGQSDVRKAKVIGLGPTALMTLSVVGSLEETLDGMSKVVIPHGTLAWLFAENQSIRSQQPSRVVEARRALELVDEGVFRTLDRGSGGGEHRREVSEDLGVLLAEIGRVRDKSRALLVVSNPVRTWDGDEMRTVDMGDFHGSLVSPLALVQTMRTEGELTDREAASVAECVGSVAQKWLQEPEIANGDALYLDQLTVGTFMQPRLLSLDLLRRLASMDHPMYVSEYTVRWYRGLRRHDEVSEEVRGQVDAIRDALRLRIESGKVRLAKRWQQTEAEGASQQHPEMDLIRVAGECDGIMTDDRFLNRYRTIGHAGRQVPVWTTWDWIRTGAAEGGDSDRKSGELATVLRRSGYLLVPITGEELRRVVGTARVEGPAVKETPEMKAMRQSVELVRDSRCLEMPREAPWLTTLIDGCARSIRSMWFDSPGEREASARAEWIGSLLWAEQWKLLALAGSESVVTDLAGRLVRSLLRGPGSAPAAKWSPYCRWVERRVAETGAVRVGQPGPGGSVGAGGAQVPSEEG